MFGRPPTTRRFEVAPTETAAERLRTFDNDVHAPKQWPLGPNTSFRRKNDTTFVVKDWTTMGAGKALPTTTATAKMSEGGTVEVVIRSRSEWLGYLLIAAGVACLALVPRDGLPALFFAIVFVAIGWFWSLSTSWRQAGLDDVESVLRQNIDGEWREAPR